MRLLPYVALTLLAPALSGCAIGAHISPLSALEQRVGGLYEGVGKGPTGHVPYRLVLSLEQKTGKVSGVMTNLESKKAYALSGTFQQAGDALNLDTALFEDGSKHRGNLRGTWQGGEFTGLLKTVLFDREILTYQVSLKQVSRIDGKAVEK